MNRKTIGKRLLFPPPIFIVLLCPAAASLLTYALIFLDTTEPASIASYLLAFYALMLIVLRIPDILRRITRFRRGNKYILRYFSDVRLRMNFSLLRAFAYNAVYSAFQLCLGLRHHSVWFYAMAGYYLLLAAMRLLLIRYTRSHAPGEYREIEWKKYRICGVCLMIMTLALAIFIVYFIWKIRVFRHHEITTIAMAAYTFTSLALAIRNTVRYRSYGSPAYSAAKTVSLVSAIVSMLTLENAMLTAFGQEGSEGFRRIMLGATGLAVLLTVQGIALYMIINSRRHLRHNESFSNITKAFGKHHSDILTGHHRAGVH